MIDMKQHFHTIIKPRRDGWFVGWVEEIPGTLSAARSLDECRDKLRDALQLILEAHRDEARLPLDRTCILGTLEVEMDEPQLTANC